MTEEQIQIRKNRLSLRCERKDAVKNRELILSAATRLFRELDPNNVSMHQIAKAAGVGQGTLYRHYSKKADICLDILKESGETYIRETEMWIQHSLNVPSHASPQSEVDILVGVITRMIDYTEDKIDILRVIDSALFTSDNPFYFKIHEMISGLLKQIVLSNPRLHEIDVNFATDILLSAIAPNQFIFERKVRGYSKSQFTSGIVNLFRAGILKQPEDS